MDQDTKLAELMNQAEQQLEEFERLAPRILALGDARFLLPLEIVESICGPATNPSPLLPSCAFRA